MMMNDLQPRVEAYAQALLDGRFGPAQAHGVVVSRGRTGGMSVSWTGVTAATSRATSGTAALTPAYDKAIAVADPHLQAPPS